MGKGGEKRSETINNAQVPHGEMMPGNTAHPLKECDICLGVSQSLSFKVCLSVALIFQEVWGKMNAYLLNISSRINFSVLFFILLQSA